MLKWLLHRQATAAPIRPLAWELPYEVGGVLRQKKKKKKKKVRKWKKVFCANRNKKKVGVTILRIDVKKNSNKRQRGTLHND